MIMRHVGQLYRAYFVTDIRTASIPIVEILFLTSNPCHFLVCLRVLEKLVLDSGDVVLDLGCGDGRWLIEAASWGCQGRGFDLNEELVLKGRRDAIEAAVSLLGFLWHAKRQNARITITYITPPTAQYYEYTAGYTVSSDTDSTRSISIMMVY